MNMNAAVIAGITVCLAVGPVMADEGKPYVGLSVGVMMPDDSTLTDRSGANAKISYSPGFSVSGTGGYAFGNGLRLEGELAYRQAAMDQIMVSGLSGKINSDLQSIGMMANAYYDFRNASAVTPYIGAGLGFANVTVGDGAINGIKVWNKADDTVFAYQVAAGVGFEINNALTFDVGYRYYATPDAKFELAKADFSSHNLMLGIRFKF